MSVFDSSTLPEPVAALLADVRGLGRRESFTTMAPNERAAWLVGLRQLADATEAAFTDALSAFDAAGDGELLHGARSSAAWLRGALGLAPGDASERVRIARAGRHHLAAAVDGLRGGAVTYDQVRAIERATGAVPPVHRAEAATILTDLARQADVAAVRAAGQRLRNVVDPDGALAQAEQQFERRYLRLSPLLDGMTSIDGLLDTEAAAMVGAALAPFLVPADSDDRRTTSQRRADGLVELARAACDHSLLPEVAGQRPHLEVITPVEWLRPGRPTPSPSPTDASTIPHLLNQPAGLGLLTGPAVQRLACDAEIGRVVLSPESVPLDVGRRHRLFTPHQRRALALRDGGCRFPGCQLPPAFTDAHHVCSWLEGGATDLQNGLLVCRHHHRQLHEGGWRIVVGAEGAHQHVEFQGPAGQRVSSTPRGP